MAVEQGGAAHRARGRRERTLRIIGGQWRGRRWRFPEAAIRPTPDRVRETLFNWLREAVPGSRCLDLFAGSGALGLEALSRGAASAVFVEQHRATAAALTDTLARWGAHAGRVESQPAERYLERVPTAPFDLVFLDPPFDSGELEMAARRLGGSWLAPRAWIYVEAARGARWQPPAAWQPWRAGAAGAVRYDLYRVGSDDGERGEA